ncbi:MAG TPA: sigma-70 family RNA polymerase sigma factor [Bryobacteraceae bacterium]|jgi:RNA polymerase sigma-70 factor (ECF subfamily)|nr:sigma-70 family RNA polymerase sigma factor [Bryobacteraceae bacterium]
MTEPFTKPKTIVSLEMKEATGIHELSPTEREVMSLFDEMRKPLLRYLGSFMLFPADSEEIVQDTFLALFQHLRRGRARHNLKGWLFRVAHNLALRRRRDDQRDRQSMSPVSIQPDECIADPGPDPEAQFSDKQTQKTLLAVVEALSDQDRRCLYLRAEGLRYREIAEILDLSISTVSVSLGRSLARISRATEG